MTWNPIAGCQIVSAACALCYAMWLGWNLEHVKKQPKYQGLTKETPAGQKLWTGKVRFWPAAMNQVTPGQSPKLIFVNSMSDLWHEDVQISWLKAIFAKMNQCPQHRFLILTKRPHIMLERQHLVTWTANIWQGVTTEDVDCAKLRLPLLRQCEAKIKFISAEPLLEDITPVVAQHIGWLDWIICGGESGTDPKRVRPMDPQWAANLRDLSVANKVAYFFKQWGNWSETGQWRGRTRKGEGLQGYLWHQHPQTALEPPVRLAA